MPTTFLDLQETIGKLRRANLQVVTSAIGLLVFVVGLFACMQGRAISATTEYLYAETPDGEIASYIIEDDGSLILAGQLPAEGAVLAQDQHEPWWPRPIWLVVQPGGEFGYSSNPVDFPRSSAYEIEYYRIDARSGVLLANPAANPHFTVEPWSPIFTPDGQVLLANNRTYAIDSHTGRLTKIGQLPMVAHIDSLAFGPNNKYIYALQWSVASVTTFRRLADGSSERVGSAPTGGVAQAIVVDPSGSFAYVTNSADNTISQYFIDPRTGALRPNPKARQIDIHYGPTSMVIGASGDFLYVVARVTDSGNTPRAAGLHRFRIASDGTLHSAGPPLDLPADVAGNQALLLDPSGRFLYLRHEVADDRQGVELTGYRISHDGSLDPLKPNSVRIMNGTVPAISWSGPKPSVQLVARDVAPLAAIKTPLAGSFTEINSGGMILHADAKGTVMPDGRVFIIQLVWGKIQAEIFDPKTGRFSLAGNVPNQAGAFLLVKLNDGRFMLPYGGKDSTVRILDPATMKLLPGGHLIKECNNANWILGDGRVLFHYMPPYRWNACGGEIYDPATGTAAEEPADLQKMEIFAQLSGDKLLVIPRSSLPPEILPWDDDDTVPLPISIYDVATGSNQPAGSMPRGFLYNDHIVLTDGRLLIFKTFLFHKHANYAELFDPNTKTFENLGQLGFPQLALRNVSGFTLTLLADGRVLIIDGSRPAIFDPLTNRFSPTGWMNQNHAGLRFLLHDGNVLFADGSPTLPETSEIYHPAPPNR